MNAQDIARISELTRISRERALTDAEQAERTRLRDEYRAAMRQNLRTTLENTDLVDQDGNRRPLVPRD